MNYFLILILNPYTLKCICKSRSESNAALFCTLCDPLFFTLSFVDHWVGQYVWNLQRTKHTSARHWLKGLCEICNGLRDACTPLHATDWVSTYEICNGLKRRLHAALLWRDGRLTCTIHDSVSGADALNALGNSEPHKPVPTLPKE